MTKKQQSDCYRVVCVEFPVMDKATPFRALPGEQFVAMCPLLPSTYKGLEQLRVAVLFAAAEKKDDEPRQLASEGSVSFGSAGEPSS
jgi:hypothetical protein